MLPKESVILITGANGLVGSALKFELEQQGYKNLICCTRESCDLKNFDQVKLLFDETKPDVVFHTAASVFGLGGNAGKKGSIFLDNILINTHVIESSQLSGVKKIIAMGTIAAYPHQPKKFPVEEDQIWDGAPHASESSYSHAKRAMLAQLQAYQEQYGLDFAYVISTNLYGPNDKFDTQNGHVIPSLIRKFYEAKENGQAVSIWGDGSASRDFLYSMDMAKALISIMNQFTGPINVASGQRSLIKDAVQILAQYFEMEDKIQWEPLQPQGRKFYEIDLTHLRSIGFTPTFTLQQGLQQTLDWFCENYQHHLVRCGL